VGGGAQIVDGAAGARGDPRVRIAVLDGPVDAAHPCFSGARLEFPQGQPLADAQSAAARHGTHVASIIFGQPGSGVAGMAPGCTGLIIPIFSSQGEGVACSQLDLARAILLALEHGAQIINISGGQRVQSTTPDLLLANAIESCARRNVLIVAAAGNDGCACLHLPAAAPTVLAVGAMGSDGSPLESSNWGSAYADQGLLAPGMGITGAVPGGGVTQRSGTSYAAPFVSGVAGLMASRQLALGLPVDPHAIRAVLLRQAFACAPAPGEDCDRVLAGRINVAGSINAIREGPIMSIDLDMPTRPDGLAWASDDSARPAADFGAASIAGSLAGVAASVTASDEDAAMTGARSSDDITPSDCGCGCGGKGKSDGHEHKKGDCGCGCGGKGGEPKKPQLVYALGKLGYDFATEARRDSIAQSMDGGANNPLSPEQMLAYLDQQSFDAPSVIWTLNLDATPIYAIQPVGAYAAAGYERLREALRAQLQDGVELISVPGVIGGSIRLQSGQVVPVIVPAIRGMYSWATRPLVEHVLGVAPAAADERDVYDRFSAGLTNFLDRVYYDLRNLGVTGEERALNYSATNAVQIAEVIRSTTRDALDLDRLAVKKSPVCRPDSECYDVELSFFNPNNTNVANRVYRFTVDVSDVIPVTVGAVRSWTRRA